LPAQILSTVFLEMTKITLFIFKNMSDRSLPAQI
jgi:hypothetical protein